MFLVLLVCILFTIYILGFDPAIIPYQVGGVYVRLFLKDPKFPLRNPKRFLEGLLDQYVTAAAATHSRGAPQVDPQLPLLLSAALVSLLRVQPLLADHVAQLGYVPKLVSAMANEGRIVTTPQQGLVRRGSQTESIWEVEDGEGMVGNQTPQERVRLSCLRVLHQLAASTACAEAMATPGMGSPQVSLWCLYLLYLLFNDLDYYYLPLWFIFMQCSTVRVGDWSSSFWGSFVLTSHEFVQIFILEIVL